MITIITGTMIGVAIMFALYVILEFIVSVRDDRSNAALSATLKPSVAVRVEYTCKESNESQNSIYKNIEGDNMTNSDDAIDPVSKMSWKYRYQTCLDLLNKDRSQREQELIKECNRFHNQLLNELAKNHKLSDENEALHKAIKIVEHK